MRRKKAENEQKALKGVRPQSRLIELSRGDTGSESTRSLLTSQRERDRKKPRKEFDGNLAQLLILIFSQQSKSVSRQEP